MFFIYHPYMCSDDLSPILRSNNSLLPLNPMPPMLLEKSINGKMHTPTRRAFKSSTCSIQPWAESIYCHSGRLASNRHRLRSVDSFLLWLRQSFHTRVFHNPTSMVHVSCLICDRCLLNTLWKPTETLTFSNVFTGDCCLTFGLISARL